MDDEFSGWLRRVPGCPTGRTPHVLPPSVPLCPQCLHSYSSTLPSSPSPRSTPRSVGPVQFLRLTLQTWYGPPVSVGSCRTWSSVFEDFPHYRPDRSAPLRSPRPTPADRRPRSAGRLDGDRPLGVDGSQRTYGPDRDRTLDIFPQTQ